MAGGGGEQGKNSLMWTEGIKYHNKHVSFNLFLILSEQNGAGPLYFILHVSI